MQATDNGVEGEPTQHAPEPGTTDLDAVAAAYRNYAPFYDVLFGRLLRPGREALCTKVQQLQPTSLLEVGVGTGLTLESYPKSSRVVGIDVSAEMLERARARLHLLKCTNIELFEMDAEQTSFASDSFECVTLPYVLSVTPNPHALLAEARRLCRAGGHILVLNHFGGSSFWWMAERCVAPFAKKVGFRSSLLLEEQIPSRDWTIESVTSVNLFGLSKLVVIRNDK
ncbi:MAG: methyltransferase domain-containing protein [Lysobacterales bacterium]